VINIDRTILDEFDREGFVIFPALLRRQEVDEARRALKLISEGLYDTGTPPLKCVPDPPRGSQFWRVDQPHISARAIYELVASRVLGRIAAALMRSGGAQVWYAHALSKPPGDPTSKVGWHQDGQYVDFFAGDFVSAWVALTDVEESCGPVVYIRRTHTLDFVKGSGFSSVGTIDDLEKRIRERLVASWDECAVNVPAGSVSFHHSRLLHGSRPNVGRRARESVTIHYRSEKNAFTRPREYNFVTEHADDNVWSPVVSDSPDLLDPRFGG
jgi:hypothetical protein